MVDLSVLGSDKNIDAGEVSRWLDEELTLCARRGGSIGRIPA